MWHLCSSPRGEIRVSNIKIIAWIDSITRIAGQRRSEFGSSTDPDPFRHQKIVAALSWWPAQSWLCWVNKRSVDTSYICGHDIHRYRGRSGHRRPGSHCGRGFGQSDRFQFEEIQYVCLTSSWGTVNILPINFYRATAWPCSMKRAIICDASATRPSPTSPTALTYWTLATSLSATRTATASTWLSSPEPVHSSEFEGPHVKVRLSLFSWLWLYGRHSVDINFDGISIPLWCYVRGVQI